MWASRPAATSSSSVAPRKASQPALRYSIPRSRFSIHIITGAASARVRKRVSLSRIAASARSRVSTSARASRTMMSEITIAAVTIAISAMTASRTCASVFCQSAAS